MVVKRVRWRCLMRYCRQRARRIALEALDGARVNLLTFREVAEELRVSPRTMRRLIDRGVLAVVCISDRKPFIEGAELNRWPLTREQIKGDHILLPKTKNGERALIPIVSSIREALKAIPFGIDRRTMTHDFDQARVAIGMPELHLHDLRRTTAVRLMEAGVELPEISMILRHKDFRTTRIYLALSPERARTTLEKIAVMKVGNA